MRAARFFSRCISFLLIFALLFPVFSTVVSAQTVQPQPTQPVSAFAEPNVDSSVPKNQHTLAQSILIEMMLAVACQLSGIDFSNPSVPCLGMNPLTNKIGYAPRSESEELQIGGLLGIATNGIGLMYTPTVTTGDYTRYLAQNFGIVKQTLAATPKDGFEGLQPILNLWKASRDVAYLMLILAFIFIGIGVMMRVKLDPRTVMTVQNQIPRIIVGILLITFSYAITAIMIDLMWASTYLAVNVISSASSNQTLKKCDGGPGRTINGLATDTILATPFSFANRVFIFNDCDLIQNGIYDLSAELGVAMHSLTRDAAAALLGVNSNMNNSKCSNFQKLTFIPEPISLIIGYAGSFIRGEGDCVFTNTFAGVALFITGSAFWMFAVFIILLFIFFRIWFELLKAYTLIILYTILAPLYIGINLLPKKPLGFEKWLRKMFANLIVFPATAAMIILARIIADEFYKRADTVFVPPLIGNPGIKGFGAIIAIGALAMTPGLLNIIKKSVNAPADELVGKTLLGAFKQGTQIASAPLKLGVKGLMEKDQQGNAVGPLALLGHDLNRRLQNDILGSLPVIGGAVKKRWEMKEHMRKHWGSVAGFGDPNAVMTHPQHGQPTPGQPAQAPATTLLTIPGPPGQPDQWNFSVSNNVEATVRAFMDTTNITSAFANHNNQDIATMMAQTNRTLANLSASEMHSLQRFLGEQRAAGNFKPQSALPQTTTP